MEGEGPGISPEARERPGGLPSRGAPGTVCAAMS